MPEVTGATRHRVGCLVPVLFVLIVVGVSAWQQDELTLGLVRNVAVVVGFGATVWTVHRWTQRRNDGEENTGRQRHDDHDPGSPQRRSEGERTTGNINGTNAHARPENRAAPAAAAVDGYINEVNAHARPDNRDRYGRPFTGRVTVQMRPGLEVDGRTVEGSVGIRLAEPVGDTAGSPLAFAGEIVSELPLVAHRRIEFGGLTEDGKLLPLFYPDRLPPEHRPHDWRRRAGKALAEAIRKAAVGPEVTHLRAEWPDPFAGPPSLVGYREVADAKDAVRTEDRQDSSSGEVHAAPIRDAESGPAKNDAQTPSAAKGAESLGATNAHRRHREWRRVGAVLSAIAAVLATIPFERSVRMLLRAYEGAEWWGERQMRSVVVGWERFSGFPGLLHASAAVLMPAATIVLFTGLALLLASDVWMPGRPDTTVARSERSRRGTTPDSGG